MVSPPPASSAKIFLIFIASLAIGVIALPQTVTLFAGQHYWYNLSGEGVGIPCEKCHADIAAEMETHIGPHSGETTISLGYTGPQYSMGDFKCFYCHSWYYTGYSLAEVNGTMVIPGTEAHAATTVSCVACHKGQKEVYTGAGPPGMENLFVVHDGGQDPNWGVAHDDIGEHGKFCKNTGLRSCVTDECHDSPYDSVNEDQWDEYPEHGTFISGFDDEGIADGHCKRCHCGLEPGGDPNNYEDYKIYHSPPAGGFGLTYFNTSNPYEGYRWDTGTLEAHNAFIEEARNDTTMKDENEACIACHTAIAVKINWTHSRSIEFEIGLGDLITTDYGPHNWTVTEWRYNGTAKSVVWGNISGYGGTDLGGLEWPGGIDNIYG